MGKTIYIAGKISGLPYWRTRLKFWLREKMLCLYGFNPVNPMRIVPNDWGYEKQMELCLDLMHLCDAIYLSHNFKNSPGAMRELSAFLETDKKKIYRFIKLKFQPYEVY